MHDIYIFFYFSKCLLLSLCLCIIDNLISVDQLISKKNISIYGERCGFESNELRM